MTRHDTKYRYLRRRRAPGKKRVRPEIAVRENVMLELESPFWKISAQLQRTAFRYQVDETTVIRIPAEPHLVH